MRGEDAALLAFGSAKRFFGFTASKLLVNRFRLSRRTVQPEKWKIMATGAPEERTRLVSLSFSDILNQRFDSVVDELMPTGANDED